MLRRLLRGAAALMLLAVFAWGVLIATVYLYGRRDEAAPADAIVVLGAAQYNGRPSPVLKARLEHALDLYRRGLAPNLIFTGGVGAGDTVSEAVVAGRYAVRAGVPPSAILTERSGLNSVQSLKAVDRMMEARGLESAILVSDPFHMLRLRLVAYPLGIRARSSPTRSSPISQDRREEWRYVVRETLSIPHMLLPPRL